MLRHLEVFAEGYQKIKVPSEFPRKTRFPNPSVLKASEWRTIALAGFVDFARVFNTPRQATQRYFWLLQVLFFTLENSIIQRSNLHLKL